MKKFRQLTYIFIALAMVLPVNVFAQVNPLKTLKEAGEDSAGYQAATVTTTAEIVGSIINAFLSLLGVIFIILMLFAGYNWMTAAGDEAKVTKAKDTIQRAIIGLIIVLSAGILTNFVFQKIFH
jgi:amino acid transporter